MRSTVLEAIPSRLESWMVKPRRNITRSGIAKFAHLCRRSDSLTLDWKRAGHHCARFSGSLYLMSRSHVSTTRQRCRSQSKLSGVPATCSWPHPCSCSTSHTSAWATQAPRRNRTECCLSRLPCAKRFLPQGLGNACRKCHIY